MWASAAKTAGQFLSFVMHSVAHEVAVRGCSWMRYLPASIWSMLILQQNSKCFVPSSLARSTFSLPSSVLTFRFWMVENGVFSGDPAIMYGRHSWIFLNAF